MFLLCRGFRQLLYHTANGNNLFVNVVFFKALAVALVNRYIAVNFIFINPRQRVRNELYTKCKANHDFAVGQWRGTTVNKL